jgi:DNA-binding IclR family transcriptional regulator
MSTSGKGVESVERALKILASFQEHDEPLSLAELSKRTGFYKSTILRMLVSLEEAGFTRKLPNKTFMLGPQVMRLSGIYQKMFRLEDFVRPALRELVRLTGESAIFFQAYGKKRICLFRENSNQGLRDHVQEGKVLPLNKGAAGHVLTRFQAVRSDAIPSRLQAMLPFVSHSEVESDTTGAGVPIFGADGSLIGALAISGPASRLTPKAMERCAAVLQRTGQNLNQALGAPG